MELERLSDAETICFLSTSGPNPLGSTMTLCSALQLRWLPDLFDLGLLSYSPFFVSAFPFTLCPSSWLCFSPSYILGVSVDISQVFGVVLVDFLQCDTNSDLSGMMSSLLRKCLQSDWPGCNSIRCCLN